MKAIGGGAVAIDTRVASEYAEGHIKGALSVPYREKSEKSAEFDASKDQFDLSKLPVNKEAAIVLYCNGPECWKSYKAATVAIKGGYSNIHWYRLGFPDWKAKACRSIRTPILLLNERWRSFLQIRLSRKTKPWPRAR